MKLWVEQGRDLRLVAPNRRCQQCELVVDGELYARRRHPHILIPPRTSRLQKELRRARWTIRNWDGVDRPTGRIPLRMTADAATVIRVRTGRADH